VGFASIRTDREYMKSGLGFTRSVGWVVDVPSYAMPASTRGAMVRKVRAIVAGTEECAASAVARLAVIEG